MTHSGNSEAASAAGEAIASHARSKARKRRGRAAGDDNASLLTTIHKLRRAIRRLRRVAVSDDLTCALNRRCLPALLDARLARARASGSVSLCLFDVDDFKKYNDLRGHHAGDEVLRRIAYAVRSNLRRSADKLFRCGGDEFCILFSSQSPSHALSLIERLREAIQLEVQAHPHANGDALTVSFGVVWQGGNVDGLLTSEELYKEADRMLYAAKRAGRGEIRRVVIDGSEHRCDTPAGKSQKNDAKGLARFSRSRQGVANSRPRSAGPPDEVLVRQSTERA
jgi:diguanylate cyclase (GGDEF)-like protein